MVAPAGATNSAANSATKYSDVVCKGAEGAYKKIAWADFVKCARDDGTKMLNGMVAVMPPDAVVVVSYDQVAMRFKISVGLKDKKADISVDYYHLVNADNIGQFDELVARLVTRVNEKEDV